MEQIIITPAGVYKWFRNLVQGYLGTGVEADDFYINQVVGTTAVKQIKYFKVGIGAPTISDDPSLDTAELSRLFYDTYCKDENGGLGDLNTPIRIFLNPADGYGGNRFRKALSAANFYSYGNSVDSKVIGVLSVVARGTGEYWDIPGVAFQVGCHLTSAEANYDAAENPVIAPSVVEINEIGLFDEDDVMILYGIFSKHDKNNTLTLRINSVAMLKALDYQADIMPTTSSTTSSTSTSSSTSSSLSTSSSTSSSSSTLSSVSTSSSSSSSSSSSTTL